MKKRSRMANLYANENFPLPVVVQLRALDHDVLTSLQAGTANQGIPDQQVLAFATGCGRAVLTHNRLDFKRLHRRQPQHAGIVICTKDTNFPALAQRIHAAVKLQEPLPGKLVSVTRG
jgi:hypothetical protein